MVQLVQSFRVGFDSVRPDEVTSNLGEQNDTIETCTWQFCWCIFGGLGNSVCSALTQSSHVFTTIYNGILIGIVTVVALSGDIHSRPCCLQTNTELLSFRASEMILSSGIHELHGTCMDRISHDDTWRTWPNKVNQTKKTWQATGQTSRHPPVDLAKALSRRWSLVQRQNSGNTLWRNSNNNGMH